MYLVPKDRLTPDLVERVRAHKAELLAHFADKQARAEALATLARLNSFTLPAGRMDAARAIALRLADAPNDPAVIVAVLRELERARDGSVSVLFLPWDPPTSELASRLYLHSDERHG